MFQGGAGSLWIRRAGLADLPALQRIEAACFATDRLSPRAMRYHVSASASVFPVTGTGPDVLGYALLSCRPRARAARLFSLAVAPQASGRGIGRALLAAVEAQAQSRGFASLRLEVREDNPVARRLYDGAGYVLFGRRLNYYEDGGTALLMHRLLPGGPAWRLPEKQPVEQDGRPETEIPSRKGSPHAVAAQGRDPVQS